jgi:hypothetical protein
MFNNVRNVNGCAINADLGQRLIEKLSGWPDEGSTETIFLVPWLFPHDHDHGFGRPFPEDRLPSRSPEVAGCTGARGPSQYRNRGSTRQEARRVHAGEFRIVPRKARRRFHGIVPR